MTEESLAPGRPADGLTRGECIGRYIVLALVGRGAMGEVYAAYDPELDRKVAVKLLRAQANSGDVTATEAKARLLREAQAIARLSHPNVVAVHDVGSFRDRVFMAMEFIDGCTVGYWLTAARRSWKDVVRIFTAAGHGLAAAHASHVVHRDFKAENVMLGRDEKVRVMDFGLARRLVGSGHDLTAAESSDPHAAAERIVREIRSTEIDAEGLTSTRIVTPPSGLGATQAPPPSERRKSSEPAGTRATKSSTTGFGTGGPSPAPVSPGPEPEPAAPAEVGARSASMLVTATGDGAAAVGASALRHSDLGGINLTQTGAIVGTPAYMAPEQFAGKIADERSDQFSFCVALYEGLYGERPFGAKTPTDLYDQVRRGEIRSAPLPTAVPSWLRRVVLRGLRVDPNERWPSMDDLLAALQKDPRVVWRRWAITGATTGAIVAIGLAARQQAVRDSRPVCTVAPQRFAGVWEPAMPPSPADDGVESRRAAVTSAFRNSGRPHAMSAFEKTAAVLDRYVHEWSSTYTENCEATQVRRQQSSETYELRMSCLGDRWSELRALSDVLADPSAEVVDNAVAAAEALVPPARCRDVEALKATVSHSVALWTTPGTMSLVSPRSRRSLAAAPGANSRRGEPERAASRDAGSPDARGRTDGWESGRDDRRGGSARDPGAR